MAIATPHQKITSEIFSGIERTRIDTERNLLDLLPARATASGA